MPAETVADPETISAFGRVTSPVGSVHAPGDASTAVIELEAIKTMTQTIALMDLPAFMEFSFCRPQPAPCRASVLALRRGTSRSRRNFTSVRSGTSGTVRDADRPETYDRSVAAELTN